LLRKGPFRRGSRSVWDVLENFPERRAEDGCPFVEPITFERRTDMGVMVGKKAPDFTAKAFHKGAEKEIKLSDFNGKWVMLCFYPADFTCV
jgi:peroxiredoxin (alkyl hydroperoxide reductase subunit C)